MRLALAYIGVILVWSSTPLAITISNRGFSFWAAGSLRMLLALMVLLPLVWLRGQRLFADKVTVMSYLIGAMGLLPNTLLVYWAAQYVPSGIISVMYSISPFVIGLLSLVLLRERDFTPRRAVALLVAACGIGMIYLDQLRIDRDSAMGIVALVFGVMAWGGSAVGLKKLNAGVDPMTQTAGSLLLAAPVLLACWWWFDGSVPANVETESLYAVVYLAVIGSVLGFTMYFFVLANTTAVTASLITLIVPVIALTLGVVLAGESLSLRLTLGVAIVLLSLFFYLNIGYRLAMLRLQRRVGRIWRKRAEVKPAAGPCGPPQ